MSWDVEKAFWRDWEPGKHVNWDAIAEGTPHTGDELRSDWHKWEKRNHDVIRLTLIALANNATIVNTDWAMTYVYVETLAGMAERSVRQTQRILRMLEMASELEKTPCDASTCKHYHGDTWHWWIPRPVASDPWGDGDVFERKRQRRLTREGKQAKAPRQRKQKKDN